MKRFTQRTIAAGLLACLSFGAARANAPAGQYTVNASSGTVVDNKSRLTWQRAVPTTMQNLADATNYCGTLGAGWRLPTIKELQTLIDDSQISPPRIDSVAFPSAPDVGFYTSSTLHASSTDLAWYVNFYTGNTGYESTQAPHNIRCVRSGTS